MMSRLAVSLLLLTPLAPGRFGARAINTLRGSNFQATRGHVSAGDEVYTQNGRHLQDSTCSNGIPGVESGLGFFCCPAACGQCGGSGCGSFAAGETCCTSDITNLCSATEEAPCIISVAPSPATTPSPLTAPTVSPTPEPVATVAPMTPVTPTPEATPSPAVDTPPTTVPVASPITSPPTPTAVSTCRNGIEGVESQQGQYCCPAACGQCGGPGCGGFAAGETCCTSAITEMCGATGTAPCRIATTPAPVTPPPATVTPSPSASQPTVSSTAPTITPPTTAPVAPPSTAPTAAPATPSTTAPATTPTTAPAAPPTVAPATTGTPTTAAPTTATPTTATPTTGAPTTAAPTTATPTTVTPTTATPTTATPTTSAPTTATPTTSAPTTATPTTVTPTTATPTTAAPTTAAPVTQPPSTITVVSPVPSPDYPMDVSAPTPVMTIPSTCTDGLPSIRWANSTAFAGRMYMEGEGCATMTDLYQTRVESDGWTSKGPIYVLDENNDIVVTPTEFTGKWLMTAELHITSGAIFYCKGSGAGGDCDELRIQSTGPTDFHEIRGHGGSLYFESTLVTSWDTPNKAPQEVYEGGRSFLNCVSEFESDETCEGQPKNDLGECRMDIIDSEMGYMGWFDSESYGLTWKVRGFCKDKSNPEVFDTTNVYGDIINSDIHHMYYGMYSYGHQGGVWTDNLMHDNHQYGFDPHDDSDYLTIARNTVYRNVNHGIIASKRCNNVEIYNNEVYDGGAQAAGIFLHRSSDSCKVYDNDVHDMQDAGMAILESFDAEIYDNTFTNVKFGIRISLGGGNNQVYDNVFDTCSSYGLYTYMGSDDPEQTTDGRPGENVFTNNQIRNTEVGVKLKEADNTIVSGNTFTGTVEMEFFDSQATTWVDNIIPASACSDFIFSDDGEIIEPSTFASGTSGVPAACE